MTDALGIPLRGVQVGYIFNLAAGGSGSVDGNGNTGTFDHLTGLDGCVVGSATTTNIPGTSAGGDAGTLTISAAGQSADITITAPVVRTLTIVVNATTAGDPVGDYQVSPASNGFSPPGQGGAVCTATITATTPTATNSCTYTFTDGSTVALSESGPAGSNFNGWTGDCTNGLTPTTSVTMSADATCTATW